MVVDGDHRMIRVGHANEKKFGLGQHHIKAYENQSLHLNYIVFAIILWARKNMIKNAVDVHLGKEAVNIDRSKFESFDDTLLQLMHHNEMSTTIVNKLNYCEGEKKDLAGMFQRRKTSVKESYCLAIAYDGNNFKDNSTKLHDECFVSHRLGKIGHTSSRRNMIGLTGGRKHFINDVNNAPIDVE